MNKFILILVVGIIFTIGCFAQTGFTTNGTISEREGEPVMIWYQGSLDTLGEANDTLWGAPISLFNKYTEYTWVMRWRFVQAGDCTTSVFMQRGPTPQATVIAATDTVRDKGVTEGSFEYYVYPLYRYSAYRDFYLPVIVNEDGGRDSTWFELRFIGYPVNN